MTRHGDPPRVELAAVGSAASQAAFRPLDVPGVDGRVLAAAKWAAMTPELAGGGGGPAMTTPKGSSGPDDPRRLGGDIAGPGGPNDRDSVVIDTSNSVLLEGSTFAIMHNRSDGRDLITLLLEGRVNRSTDRTRVLYLLGADGLAALLTEGASLLKRLSTQPSMQELFSEAMECLDERTAKLEAEGLL